LGFLKFLSGRVSFEVFNSFSGGEIKPGGHSIKFFFFQEKNLKRRKKYIFLMGQVVPIPNF
jgi:hypothetical protein